MIRDASPRARARLAGRKRKRTPTKAVAGPPLPGTRPGAGRPGGAPASAKRRAKLRSKPPQFTHPRRHIPEYKVKKEHPHPQAVEQRERRYARQLTRYVKREAERDEAERDIPVSAKRVFGTPKAPRFGKEGAPTPLALTPSKELESIKKVTWTPQAQARSRKADIRAATTLVELATAPVAVTKVPRAVSLVKTGIGALKGNAAKQAVKQAPQQVKRAVPRAARSVKTAPRRTAKYTKAKATTKVRRTKAVVKHPVKVPKARAKARAKTFGRSKVRGTLKTAKGTTYVAAPTVAVGDVAARDKKSVPATFATEQARAFKRHPSQYLTRTAGFVPGALAGTVQVGYELATDPEKAIKHQGETLKEFAGYLSSDPEKQRKLAESYGAGPFALGGLVGGARVVGKTKTAKKRRAKMDVARETARARRAAEHQAGTRVKRTREAFDEALGKEAPRHLRAQATLLQDVSLTNSRKAEKRLKAKVEGHREEGARKRAPVDPDIPIEATDVAELYHRVKEANKRGVNYIEGSGLAAAARAFQKESRETGAYVEPVVPKDVQTVAQNLDLAQREGVNVPETPGRAGRGKGGREGRVVGTGKSIVSVRGEIKGHGKRAGELRAEARNPREAAKEVKQARDGMHRADAAVRVEAERMKRLRRSRTTTTPSKAAAPEGVLTQTELRVAREFQGSKATVTDSLTHKQADKLLEAGERARTARTRYAQARANQRATREGLRGQAAVERGTAQAKRAAIRESTIERQRAEFAPIIEQVRRREELEPASYVKRESAGKRELAEAVEGSREPSVGIKGRKSRNVLAQTGEAIADPQKIIYDTLYQPVIRKEVISATQQIYKRGAKVLTPEVRVAANELLPESAQLPERFTGAGNVLNGQQAVAVRANLPKDQVLVAAPASARDFITTDRMISGEAAEVFAELKAGQRPRHKQYVAVDRARQRELMAQAKGPGGAIKLALAAGRAQSYALLKWNPGWAASQLVAEGLPATASAGLRTAKIPIYEKALRAEPADIQAAFRSYAGSSFGPSFERTHSRVLELAKDTTKENFWQKAWEAGAVKTPLGMFDRAKGDFYRRVVLHAEIDRITSREPKLRKTLKSMGLALKEIDAINAKLKGLPYKQRLEWAAGHPEVMRQASLKLEDVMGNWTDYTGSAPRFGKDGKYELPSERTLAAIGFFYPMLRYLTNFTFHTFPKHHPIKATTAYYFGLQNTDALLDYYGGMPKSLYDLAVPKGRPGQKNAPASGIVQRVTPGLSPVSQAGFEGLDTRSALGLVQPAAGIGLALTEKYPRKPLSEQPVKRGSEWPFEAEPLTFPERATRAGLQAGRLISPLSQAERGIVGHQDPLAAFKKRKTYGASAPFWDAVLPSAKAKTQRALTGGFVGGQEPWKVRAIMHYTRAGDAKDQREKDRLIAAARQGTLRRYVENKPYEPNIRKPRKARKARQAR